LRPQRGDKVRLCEMAAENARQSFVARRNTEDQRSKMVEELQRRLALRSAPKRIECFDISNLQGRQIVGSMVVFDEGEPDKNRYRRYRVKTVAGQDDFASLYEVLKRRYSRALVENDFPDLLVIDGGKGQLGVAGAGPSRRRRLLKHFGSLRRLTAASAEEVSAVPGIGAELAAVIVVKLKEVEEAAASTGKKRLVLKPVDSH